MLNNADYDDLPEEVRSQLKPERFAGQPTTKHKTASNRTRMVLEVLSKMNTHMTLNDLIIAFWSTHNQVLYRATALPLLEKLIENGEVFSDRELAGRGYTRRYSLTPFKGTSAEVIEEIVHSSHSAPVLAHVHVAA